MAYVLLACVHTGELVDHVTDIISVKGGRGGRYIEDLFEVRSTDVVEALVGEFNVKGLGLAIFRDREKTGVAMVPPLEFKFKTKRDGDNPRKYPTELVVTAHFMCVVKRPGRNDMRWAFDDDRAEYSALHKHAYKIALADAMQRMGPDVVPERLLEWLQPLL